MNPKQPREGLTTSQVLILQVLADEPEGLSRSALIERLPIGITAKLSSLGDADASLPYSLKDRGLVAPYLEVDNTDRGFIVWKITAKGKKVASTSKAKAPLPLDQRIPDTVLDPVVVKFKATRTYGFESYTDADVCLVRDQCGKEYAHITPDSMRHLIVTRRKKRAYTDPSKKLRIAVQRCLRDFGPGGDIKELLSASQIAQLKSLLPV